MEIFTRTRYTIIDGKKVYHNPQREWAEEALEIQGSSPCYYYLTA